MRNNIDNLRSSVGALIGKINSRQGQLTIALGLLSLPVIVLGWMFFNSHIENVNFARRELLGVAYFRTVLPMLAQVTERNDRSLTADEFLRATQKLNVDLGVSVEAERVAFELQKLPADPISTATAIHDLLKVVGAKSNLILDPVLESYHTMIVVVDHVPNLLIGTRDLRNALQQLPSKKNVEEMHGDEHYEATSIAAHARLVDTVQNVNSSISIALSEASSPTLKPAFGATLAQINFLTQYIWGSISETRYADVHNNVLETIRDKLIIQQDALVLQYIQLANRASMALEEMLQHRIDGYNNLLLQALGLTTLVALLATLVSYRALGEILNRLDDQIVVLADQDPLTNVLNRRTFGLKLQSQLKRLRSNESLTVLCLDLDHFKSVNDSLGHSIGDGLLKQVVSRIKNNVRSDDIVARLGGDEFVVLQHIGSSGHEAEATAKRLVQALSESFIVDDHHVEIGVSIGIAMAPADAVDANALLKLADIALYKAKANGRNGYCRFEAGMDDAIKQRLTMEVDLRMAVQKNQFEVYYQPLFDLRKNCVVGFEALVRWNHPTRGMISPLQFIPLAEETGLITRIGSWVLRQACQDAATWPEHISVAVNLSAVQFKGSVLKDIVVDALRDASLPSSRLELEITESILLQDTESVLATLRDLRELGVRISMDDFGTGYSSIGYLQKFPFDKIKIDRSFVTDINTKSDSLAIVRALTSMSKSLRIKTTAEGVETEQELDCLRLEGCDQVQGYLISKPVPVSALGALLGHPAAKETAA
jgi:diguanylate cyclase (GGDEF)-like protein